MKLRQFIGLFAALWICGASATTVQDITAKQGAALNVTLAGAESSLQGRTLRMHVRKTFATTSTKFVASTSDGRLTVGSTPYTSAALSVGSDVLAAVPVTAPVEYWVYDVESYTTAADVRREWSGKFTITRDVTRDTEAATETALSGAVLYSGPQSLTADQQTQAWGNIGGSEQARDAIGTALVAGSGMTVTVSDAGDTITLASSGGGGGASDHGDLTGLGDDDHTQYHNDARGDARYEALGAVSTHNGVTTAHGISSYGATLVDDANAGAARTTLGLGDSAVLSVGTTAGTVAAGDAAAGLITTHAGATDPHGDRAYTDSAIPTAILPIIVSSNTVEQRNGANAQTWRFYSTYTDGSNYERLGFGSATYSGQAWISIGAQTAGTGADRISVAFSPVGDGAVTAHAADGTTAGGENRGLRAVDWQTSRSNAANVASGNTSTIGGGSDNQTPGGGATIAGGLGNLAYDVAAIGGGQSNRASPYAAVAGGLSNQASAEYSSITGGRGSFANGHYSRAGGYSSDARGIYGADVYASGQRAARGDHQRMELVARGTTTGATSTALTTDGGSAGSANQLILPNNSSTTVLVKVTGNVRGASGMWGSLYVIDIKRGANAAATAIEGTPTTVHSTNTTGGGVTFALTADTTNGGLRGTATGDTGLTIDWTAHIESVSATE